MTTIRLLTYNIHKGFTIGPQRYVLNQIKHSIKSLTDIDFVCLQEVVGEHLHHVQHLSPHWTTSTAQFEYLAHELFPYFAYGKNAIYPEGNHGNAILSRLPILSFENEDVSLTKIERRGLLHAIIPIPNHEHPLHLFCIHLGLFEKDRRTQVDRLAQRIGRSVPAQAPMIIAGDFNDWRENLSLILATDLGLKEAYFEEKKKHAKTFPSFFPLFSLDRIYYRNMRCLSAEPLFQGDWTKLSDHLPLQGIFEL